MDDDYHTYRNADTEEQRQSIKNRFSDQEMFESAMVWSMHDYRKRAYPPIEEQLDTIYRNGLEHWKSEIQDIKCKYPDMTNAYTKKYHDTTLEALEERLDSKLATKSDLQAELAKTKTQLDEQRALHETTRADMDSTKADLETIKTDLVTLQAATVNVDLDHLITQITLLQNVVFSLTKRLEALEQA